MTERLEWRDIAGYEGLYKVSEYGDIKSLERKIKSSRGMRTKKERILKPYSNNNYQRIYLSKDGKSQEFSIHRLVAINFIRTPEEGEIVNHIDGDKTNNHHSNLEWCTIKENNSHAIKTGLWKAFGTDHYLSKFTTEDLKRIESLRDEGETHREISKIFNVHEGTISKLLRKETYSTTARQTLERDSE